MSNNLPPSWLDDAIAEAYQIARKRRRRFLPVSDWYTKHARDNQKPPDGEDWFIWLTLAGRGFGKTRLAAEYVQWAVSTGRAGRVALVGRTAADVRDVMVEGVSGILAVAPSGAAPRYEPSKRRLTWPNGAVATTYSADKPAQLRGPEHDLIWADELAAWGNPATWDNLILGLRRGRRPHAVVTTTPVARPLITSLVYETPGVAIVRGSTYDNRDNLPETFVRQIERMYSGTRLERQELYGEILDDTPGALWSRDVIEAGRYVGELPEFYRVAVGVDPAVSSSGTTGIVVAGVTKTGRDLTAYVLDDLSVSGAPADWAAAVVSAYHKYAADLVVFERNQGGDMGREIIRNAPGGARVNVKDVTAARGKHARAEPVSAEYKHGRVRHVGMFRDLENQLCSWVPGDADSPDRLDALVWVLSELLLGAAARTEVTTLRIPSRRR